MKSLESYIEAWPTLFSNAKLWITLFCTTLLFALFIASPFNQFIEDSFGHSAALNASIGKFDYTFIADALNNHGAKITTLFYSLKWIILLFVLLMVFLTGGMVYQIAMNPSKFTLANFVNNCMEHFWKYFKLFFIFIIIQVVLLAVLLLTLNILLDGFSPFELEDDSRFTSTLNNGLIIYAIFLTLSLIIYDLCKVYILKYANQLNLLGIIKKGIKTALQNFGSFMLLFLFNLGTLVLFYFIFKYLKALTVGPDHFMPLFAILITILFAFTRTGLRIFNIAGVNNLSNKI